jgi:hypothetical protein
VPTPVSHPSTVNAAASTNTVSVIVCTYSQRRWEALLAAVASVASQTHPPLETIVVIDHNSELFDRTQATLQGARVVENDGENGLSARNTGLKAARGEIVAFRRRAQRPPRARRVSASVARYHVRTCARRLAL